jgi:hypothetical protein
MLSSATRVTGRKITFGKLTAHALAVKVDVSNRIAVFLSL